MELLGIGRQAEVYAINEVECIKLFYPDCPKNVVEDEAARLRYVSEHGVPSPRFIAVEQRDGRYGIRMERLHGLTLLYDAIHNFRADVDYGALLGSIQRSYHQLPAQGLGDMVDSLTRQIGYSDAIPPEWKRELIRRLGLMPRGDRLVHLDYHSDNVVMTSDGAKVIDWTSACAGNPLADAARTLLTLELRSYPMDADDKMRDWLDQTRSICREGYLRGYGAPVEQIDAWKPFIAASRLFCCAEEEREQNVSLIGDYLRGA